MVMVNDVKHLDIVAISLYLLGPDRISLFWVPSFTSHRRGGLVGDFVGSSPQERSTLGDVAALAGVSAKTASRALNGHPGVSSETRERVEQAAIKLRFRPNGLAKELRTGGRSSAVGLVVADLSNPFFSRVAAAVEATVQPRGLELFIGSTGESPQRERDVVRSFLERRVQALLIVPSSDDHGYLQFEASVGTPIVFLDRPPVRLSADTVTGDNFVAARDATQALIDAGHERIGILGDNQQAWTSRERLAGAREAFRANGRDPFGPLVREGAHTTEIGMQQMKRLLDDPEPPTAVFALNNLLTLGALRVMREMGSSLVIVSFDDVDAAQLLDVSAVSLDPAQMGRRAAEMALARLDGDESAPVTEIIPTMLTVRTPLDTPLTLATRS
jgi:LacI family transcriptional regulator